MISGDTWAGIITNSDLNGKINKQKIWNAFNYKTRSSDGFLATTTDSTFKWTVTTNSKYAYTFNIENIQNNYSSNFHTKLSTNNKTYLDKNKLQYHVYCAYGQYTDSNHSPTGISSNLTDYCTTLSTIYSKTTYIDGYYMGFGNYKNYKLSANTNFANFRASPSFRPQFTFKESS